MSTSGMLPLYINLGNLIQHASCFSLVEHLSLIHFFSRFWQLKIHLMLK